MRRLIPWLIGSAVGVIAIVAAVDAFRGGARGPVASPTPSSPPVEPDPAFAADAQVLRDAGATGRLVYTDASCRSVALGLPELARSPVDTGPGCSREPAGDGWTAVDQAARAVLPEVCLRNDTPPPQGCDQVVLTRRRAQAELGAAGDVSFREVAWLGAMRLAAIVHDHDRNLDVLAIFEERKLVGRPALAAASLSGFGVSPLRRHLAVRSSAGGIFVLDWEGRFALPGRFRFPLLETRAVAWSPDDAWTALATRNRLYLLETDPAARDVVDLPVSAIGLEWQR